MARLTSEQKRWLTFLEDSPAHGQIDRQELLLLLYAIKRRHMHIPEESLACLYLDFASELRDICRVETTGDGLRDAISAHLVQLSAISAALTRRQRGRPPLSGDRDPDDS